MNNKKEIEIFIDEEDAIDNFGEDTFQENITTFIEGGFRHTYEGIKEAEFNKDHSKMKLLTHTLKTTARYMSSENFAQICQKIESETKVPNWDKILENLEDFYFYLNILYEKTLTIYNKIHGHPLDKSGPIDNKIENMEFYYREEEMKKSSNKTIQDSKKEKHFGEFEVKNL